MSHNDNVLKSSREIVLEMATDAVMKQRNNTYGPPTQDFDRAAAILNALGFSFCLNEWGDGGQVQEIAAHHIAMIMVALKMSRLAWSPEHLDNWVDIAGYAACGWECYEEEDE